MAHLATWKVNKMAHLATWNVNKMAHLAMTHCLEEEPKQGSITGLVDGNGSLKNQQQKTHLTF